MPLKNILKNYFILLLFWYQHENYSPTGGFENDIAMIELPEILDLNPKSVFPICIASKQLSIDPHDCWMTGWGNTEGKWAYNLFKQYERCVQKMIIKVALCKAVYWYNSLIVK